MALEHAIPEQMFTSPQNPGEAISAVKAIAKAQQAGQRIYHITQANMATALPNIHHDANTMEEIRNALTVGKEVTTHTDPVSVPGYTGAGYIIIDPDTGIGAYKIGGGMNGSEEKIDYDFATLLGFSAFAGAADGVSKSIGNDLLNSTFAAQKLATELAKFAKFVGVTALIGEIVSTILDQGMSVTDKVGRIIMAVFGYYAADLLVTSVASLFAPPLALFHAISLAVIAAALVVTLTIVLLDFNEIYLSYYDEREYFYV